MNEKSNHLAEARLPLPVAGEVLEKEYQAPLPAIAFRVMQWKREEEEEEEEEEWW